MVSILGWAITGLTALILFLVGLLGLTGWTSIGKMIRGFGKSTLRGFAVFVFAIFLILGIAGGGVMFGFTGIKGLFGVATTASVFQEEPVVTGIEALDCQVSAVGLTIASAGATGTSVRTDVTNLKNYYVDMPQTNFTATNIIYPNITCNRGGNIRQGVSTTCLAKCGSFKSLTSTTDSNTYYICGTATTRSVVPGYTWQQSVYLADNAIATTSSTKEKIQFVFAQDEATQALNIAITPPGATVGGYLTNNTAIPVIIECDGQEVSRITINKVA